MKSGNDRHSNYSKLQSSTNYSSAMTKYQGKRKYSDYSSAGYEGNFLDKIYNSFSTDFWLIVANITLVTNWFLNPESLVATMAMAGSASLVIFVILHNNHRMNRIFSNFIANHTKTGLLTLTLGLVTTITVFNFMTSPSHALILTEEGVSVLKTLFSGSGGTNVAADKIIGLMILVFRVLFFLGFMLALYRAYDKYAQQAELGDVVQTPLVLLIVVGIVDGAAAMFLKAANTVTPTVITSP
jgi:hypothetical protein